MVQKSKSETLYTLAEIRADIEALERETGGLLEPILVQAKKCGMNLCEQFCSLYIIVSQQYSPPSCAASPR